MADEAQEDAQQGGGSPAWMMTYSDSITLLLTFFVLLLTFSTPNEEGFAELSQGFMQGSRELPDPDGIRGHNSMVAEEKRLAESRLTSEGAEKAPTRQESPLDMLTKHHDTVDISTLEDLKGAQVIRMPLVDLFGTGLELTTDGRKVLDHIVKITRAMRYSVVIRAEAVGVDEDAGAQAHQSVCLGLQVARYLKESTGDLCYDIGVSNNVQLLGSPLKQGMCEIIMLEV